MDYVFPVIPIRKLIIRNFVGRERKNGDPRAQTLKQIKKHYSKIWCAKITAKQECNKHNQQQIPRKERIKINETNKLETGAWNFDQLERWWRRNKRVNHRDLISSRYWIYYIKEQKAIRMSEKALAYLNDISIWVFLAAHVWCTNIHLTMPSLQLQFQSQPTM